MLVLHFYSALQYGCRRKHPVSDQENRGEGYRCGVGSEASAQVLSRIRACGKHVPQLL